MGRRKTKSKGNKKSQREEHVSKRNPKYEEAIEDTEVGDNETEGDAKSSGKTKFSIDQILEKVEDYMDEFNYQMAKKFCERALEMDSNNVRALETSGTLLLEMDDIENAKQCFGRAISLQPDEGHAKYMYMGQLLTGQEAIAAFTRGIHIMNSVLQNQQASSSISGEVTNQEVSNAYCSIAEIYLTDECMAEDAEGQCRSTLEKAIAANPENPEAYQLMASFYMSIDDKQKAKENIEKSVWLWLPGLREADQPDGGAVDPVSVCPVSYSARVNAAKTLIEVQNHDCASEILELLLDEEEDIVEVWYLLGWLNYLQKEDYVSNARFYLTKAKEVAAKTKFDDQEMLTHIENILEELGPEPEDEDANGHNDEGCEDDDDDMETELTSQPDGMEH